MELVEMPSGLWEIASPMFNGTITSEKARAIAEELYQLAAVAEKHNASLEK
jgi:hypothetical protein